MSRFVQTSEEPWADALSNQQPYHPAALWLLPLAVMLIVIATAVPSGLRMPALHYLDTRLIPEDMVANFLLYLPLGLALGRRGVRNSALIGAILSAAIESAQFFMADRSPSFTDVAMNTAGTVAGALIASSCGRWFRWYPDLFPLTWLRAVAALVLGLVVTTPRALESNFSNWNPNYQLLIGDELSGGQPWHGILYRAVILDHALSDEQVHSLSGDPAKASFPAAALDWQRGPGAPRIWSRQESRRMLDPVERSGRLSLILWLRPKSLDEGGPARILTYSKDDSRRNFTFGQHEGSLVFRLRTPVSGLGGSGCQLVTPPVLEPGRLALVAVTYDGRTSRLYVDGRLADSRRLPQRRTLFRFPGETESAHAFAGGLLLAIGVFGLLRSSSERTRSVIVLVVGIAGGMLFWFADGTTSPRRALYLGTLAGVAVLLAGHPPRFMAWLLPGARQRLPETPSPAVSPRRTGPA